MENYKYIGKGVYSISDAQRFTRISRPKIRHWVRGDLRTGDYGRNSVPPIISPQYEKIDDKYALGFLDLIELLVINRLKEKDFTIPLIRIMHENGKKQLKHSHPFAFLELYTAGHDLIANIPDEEVGDMLVSLRNNNVNLKEIVSIYLENIDFSDVKPSISLRWWPIGRENGIVLDPKRSFGQPIVSERGVPTYILASAVKAEGSPEKTANLYKVSLEHVKKAFEYEVEYTQRVSA